MLETNLMVGVVGEAGDRVEAVALANKLQPGLLLLDVDMPLKRLLTTPSSPGILVFSMHTDERLVRGLVAQGASGYVAKSASIEELLAAAHSAVQCPRSPQGDNATLVVPRSVIERAEEGKSPPSPRQLEILLLAGCGFSNRQIASSLRLAEGTVKRHLANINQELRVGSRHEAVNKALSEKWITVQDLTHT